MALLSQSFLRANKQFPVDGTRIDFKHTLITSQTALIARKSQSSTKTTVSLNRCDKQSSFLHLHINTKSH